MADKAPEDASKNKVITEIKSKLKAGGKGRTASENHRRFISPRN